MLPATQGAGGCASGVLGPARARPNSGVRTAPAPCVIGKESIAGGWACGPRRHARIAWRRRDSQKLCAAANSCFPVPRPPPDRGFSCQVHCFVLLHRITHRVLTGGFIERNTRFHVGPWPAACADRGPHHHGLSTALPLQAGRGGPERSWGVYKHSFLPHLCGCGCVCVFSGTWGPVMSCSRTLFYSTNCWVVVSTSPGGLTVSASPGGFVWAATLC